MASAEPQKVPDPEACEPAKGLEEPAPEVVPAPLPPRPTDAFLLADVSLRVVLFAVCLTAVVVLVTSNQTKIVALPGLPFPAPVETKFSHSPAFIFFVAALSVAGLYSIITVLASTSVILKPDFALDFVLFFLLWDVVILGIVASATGAAGAVAYIGLKGNSHAGWNKVCNVYNKYCQHLGAAIPIALFAAVILVLLITLSVLSLHRKVPK